MKQPKTNQPTPEVVRPQFDHVRQMWFVETDPAPGKSEFIEGYFASEQTADQIVDQVTMLYPKKYKK